jgi:hypothetical protein
LSGTNDNLQKQINDLISGVDVINIDSETITFTETINNITAETFDHINNISESNAIVLPVPHPQTIQFINLNGYKDIFEDCDKCFYNPTKSISYKINNFYSNSLKTHL